MTRVRPDCWDVDAAASNLVLTRRELHDLGVTQRMIWARVRPGGPWRRLLPGVIMLRNGAPTWPQTIDAALRYAGAGAIVTGLTAARLHGMKKLPPTDAVHVLIPEPRQRRSCGFALIERTTRLPSIHQMHGFPTADVTRAVLDATRRLGKRDDVEALVAEAVQSRRTSPQMLRKELEEGSGRGSALPRLCLAPIEDGARSTAEARGMNLASRSGLPPMRWNARLRTAGGVRLPTPDGWLDDVGLAWEIDSYEYHLSPSDYRRTLERHNIMTAHGIVVLHTLPSQLKVAPDAVIQQLRETYRRALERPRPAIVAEW